MSEPYVGQIIIFGFSFAPINYAYCQGQSMPIAQNQALFALLGTTYGGNGQTTYALPNIQDRAVMSMGQGPGLTNYALGETSGTANVTLNVTQIPMHNHSISATAGNIDELLPTSNGWLGSLAQPPKMYSTDAPSSTVMSPQQLASIGGSLPHVNEQPYLGMNFCIALYGIFPSQN